MIITDVEQGWNTKVNFTDSNDVFVGYDTMQDCCEDAGYFFTYNEEETYSFSGQSDFNVEDIEGYIFDTDFFKEVEGNRDLEEGGEVVFKLIKESHPVVYLHLYNSHNGYYGHGFSATISGESWESGGL